jgi:hypothetical protein
MDENTIVHKEPIDNQIQYLVNHKVMDKVEDGEIMVGGKKNQSTS